MKKLNKTHKNTDPCAYFLLSIILIDGDQRTSHEQNHKRNDYFESWFLSLYDVSANKLRHRYYLDTLNSFHLLKQIVLFYVYGIWRLLTINRTNAVARGIHRWPVDSPHKGLWHGELIFSLMRLWTNSWAISRDAGELRCNGAHFDVTVMSTPVLTDMTIQIFWRSSQSAACWPSSSECEEKVRK